MRILVACEESQAVTIAFRNKGHEAYSCDLQECSGGHPEWHIQGDAIAELYSGGYDMAVTFPPCTHLSGAGAPSWAIKKADGRQGEAIEFVKKIWAAPVEYLCIENPTGILNTAWMKPTQIIHPFYFGDPFMKRTCLWLRGFPPLIYSSKTVVAPTHHYTSNSYRGGKRKDGTRKVSNLPVFKAWDNSKERSKTFPGIAQAMADQWSDPTKFITQQKLFAA